MQIINKQKKFAVTINTSSKQHGDMRNRDLLYSWLSDNTFRPESFIHGKQVHSNIVTIITSPRQQYKPIISDGFVTSYNIGNKTSFTLGILTADCLPILCWDIQQGIIGAVHAGWKGIKHNIIASCISKMVSLGSNTDTIKVIIGPHIHVCCYEVSDNFANDFLYINPHCIRNQDNKSYLNLELIAINQLEYEGIMKHNIISTQECTSCLHTKYFSYRKHYPDTFGEQISVISIQPYE
jgi:polyphenol oxidase